MFANIIPRFNRASTTPPNLSLYKYEGNFYPAFASKKINSNVFQGFVQEDGKTRYLNPVQLSHQIYHNFHDEDQTSYGATGSDYPVAMKVQPLQQINASGKRIESGVSKERNLKLNPMLADMENTTVNQDQFNRRNEFNNLMDIGTSNIDGVTRHYHDIYLKLKSPQELVFGHVLSWPGSAEKKVEKRKKNHFKGQVIWADKTGGYGEHYWDLAQGAL